MKNAKKFGKVIYLNGTSSSGKSTVSKALSQLIPDAAVVSADDFGEEFEKRLGELDKECAKTAEKHESMFSKLQAGAENTRAQYDDLYNVINDTPLPYRCNSDLQMYDHVAKMASAGQNVIVDDLISTDHLYKEFLTVFEDIDVTMILVCAPIEELRARETKRGDRPLGMAEYWQESRMVVKKYDLTVDTGKLSPVQCASQISEYLENSSI